MKRFLSIFLTFLLLLSSLTTVALQAQDEENDGDEEVEQTSIMLKNGDVDKIDFSMIKEAVVHFKTPVTLPGGTSPISTLRMTRHEGGFFTTKDLGLAAKAIVDYFLLDGVPHYVKGPTDSDSAGASTWQVTEGTGRSEEIDVSDPAKDGSTNYWLEYYMDPVLVNTDHTGYGESLNTGDGVYREESPVHMEFWPTSESYYIESVSRDGLVLDFGEGPGELNEIPDTTPGAISYDFNIPAVDETTEPPTFPEDVLFEVFTLPYLYTVEVVVKDLLSGDVVDTVKWEIDEEFMDPDKPEDLPDGVTYEPGYLKGTDVELSSIQAIDTHKIVDIEYTGKPDDNGTGPILIIENIQQDTIVTIYTSLRPDTYTVEIKAADGSEGLIYGDGYWVIDEETPIARDYGAEEGYLITSLVINDVTVINGNIQDELTKLVEDLSFSDDSISQDYVIVVGVGKPEIEVIKRAVVAENSLVDKTDWHEGNRVWYRFEVNNTGDVYFDLVRLIDEDVTFVDGDDDPNTISFGTFWDTQLDENSETVAYGYYDIPVGGTLPRTFTNNVSAYGYDLYPSEEVDNVLGLEELAQSTSSAAIRIDVYEGPVYTVEIKAAAGSEELVYGDGITYYEEGEYADRNYGAIDEYLITSLVINDIVIFVNTTDEISRLLKDLSFSDDSISQDYVIVLGVGKPEIEVIKTAVEAKDSIVEKTNWYEGRQVWYRFEVKNIGDVNFDDFELIDEDVVLVNGDGSVMDSPWLGSLDKDAKTVVYGYYNIPITGLARTFTNDVTVIAYDKYRMENFPMVTELARSTSSAAISILIPDPGDPDDPDPDDPDDPDDPEPRTTTTTRETVRYTLELVTDEGVDFVLYSDGIFTFSPGTVVNVTFLIRNNYELIGFSSDSDDEDIVGNFITMDGNKVLKLSSSEIVRLQPELIPEEPPVIEPEVIFTPDVIPEDLPKTSGIPLQLFLYYGGLTTSFGLMLRKKFK